MSEQIIQNEISVMEFSTYITNNRLKTSAKLSKTTDDVVEHFMVNRKGEVLARSIRTRLETPIKSQFGKDIEWDTKYFSA